MYLTLTVLGPCYVPSTFCSCSQWGLLSNSHVWASHYGGFSCCRVWTLCARASEVVMHRLR